jgi:thiol-disulfide isomerase/thioredoxin
MERRRGEEPAWFRVSAKKAGLAGVITNHIFVPDAKSTVQLEPLVLKPGCNLPLRIVGEDGTPVEGAWVEYHERPVSIAKSDSFGYCVLKDLPAGPCQPLVSYGELRASPTFGVDHSTGLQPAVTVTLARTEATPVTAPPPAPNAVKLGEMAPEWNVRAWSDGRSRNLAALRGKVVVIDFWALGCAPCRQVCLPVENRLQDKYGDEVVFITIHPAGTEMHLLKELIDAQGWKLLVGLDDGPNESGSHTLQRYGVRGFPTEVIIDRGGRVLHNSADRPEKDEVARRMQATAEEIGLPWPIEKDADQEEIARRLRRFHEHWLGRQIDKALSFP